MGSHILGAWNLFKFSWHDFCNLTQYTSSSGWVKPLNTPIMVIHWTLRWKCFREKRYLGEPWFATHILIVFVKRCDKLKFTLWDLAYICQISAFYCSGIPWNLSILRRHFAHKFKGLLSMSWPALWIGWF